MGGSVGTAGLLFWIRILLGWPHQASRFSGFSGMASFKMFSAPPPLVGPIIILRSADVRSDFTVCLCVEWGRAGIANRVCRVLCVSPSLHPFTPCCILPPSTATPCCIPSPFSPRPHPLRLLTGAMASDCWISIDGAESLSLQVRLGPRATERILYCRCTVPVHCTVWTIHLNK